MQQRAVVAVIGVIIFVSGARAADLTECGSVVAAGQSAALVADLDCAGSGTFCAVTIERDASLALGGHTISGATYGLCVADASGNVGTAAVTGPGRITGCEAGIQSMRGRLELRDLLVEENTGDGVLAGQARVLAVNVGVNRNGRDGFTATGLGSRLDADGLTASENGRDGIAVNRGRGTAVTAVGNGEAGIVGGVVRFANATVTGNFGWGTSVKRLVLTDSVLTGNGTGDAWDVGSVARPRLPGTQCDRSRRLGRDGGTWAVCALD